MNNDKNEDLISEAVGEALVRPGISARTLLEAEIHRADPDEAEYYTGLRAEGILIPFLDVDGNPVYDSDQPFARLRLDQPRGEQKYHQAEGTGSHIYFPPGWSQGKFGGLERLFLCEGEFKALSMVESGFCAVGVLGFWSWQSHGEITTEWDIIINAYSPKEIVFVGDQDTILNPDFARAICSLWKMLVGKLYIAPLSLDAGGKGIDDVRESLGSNSGREDLERILEKTMREILVHTKPGQLAADLLESVAPDLRSGMYPSGWDKAKVKDRLVRTASAFPKERVATEEIVAMAIDILQCGKRAFQAEIKEEKIRLRRELAAKQTESSDETVIDLGSQTGEWTDQVLSAVAEETYIFANQLCTYQDANLVPMKAIELPSFLDRPGRCRFGQFSPDGLFSPRTFDERLAKLVLGNMKRTGVAMRRVTTVCSEPVLAWNRDSASARVIYGYDAATGTLAGGQSLSLPRPEEAAGLLEEIFCDFSFGSSESYGRALALLFSPALAQGGFLEGGRVPFFWVEKDVCGAGGGTLAKLVSTIYGIPAASASRTDNKNALLEEISRKLLSGATFIYIDNVRSGMERIPEFESLLSEPIFSCRAPYEMADVDVTQRVFAGTSNGAVLSSDLADRSCRIRLSKQPQGYQWKKWTEGSLLQHVAQKRLVYLGAIYSLISDWIEAGRPPGATVGFRFSEWEVSMSGILSRAFPDLQLFGADYGAEQKELADPSRDLLRAIFRIVATDAPTAEFLSPTSLARVAVEHGIIEGDPEKENARIGRALVAHFSDEGEFPFDQGAFTVLRKDEFDENRNKIKRYKICRGEVLKL